MNYVACEDHYSFENYTQMSIAAIFLLLEKIGPTIEREYIIYIYIYIFSIENRYIFSLFLVKNGSFSC